MTHVTGAAPPHVCVISSGRPSNVVATNLAMQGLPAATWYVGNGEADAYRAFGAEGVREVAGGLAAARNAALEDAFADDRACLQIDDGLRRIVAFEERSDLHPRVVGLAQAVAILTGELFRSASARLAGAGDGGGPGPYAWRGISRHHYVPGSLMLVAPSSPRFDPRLRAHGDYDFTAQHLTAYGEVCRVDRVIPQFHHSRAPHPLAAEEDAVALLTSKWPQRIYPNPRRPGSVLMRWEQGRLRPGRRGLRP